MIPSREEIERIDVTIVRNPMTAHLAVLLDVPLNHAVGLMIFVLGWGEDAVPSGSAPALPPEVIDKALDYPGLAAALLASGWLENKGPGIHFAPLGPWSPEWLALKNQPQKRSAYRKPRRKAKPRRRSSSAR